MSTPSMCKLLGLGLGEVKLQPALSGPLANRRQWFQPQGFLILAWVLAQLKAAGIR